MQAPTKLPTGIFKIAGQVQDTQLAKLLPEELDDDTQRIHIPLLHLRRDLATYGAALGSEAASIPANTLSYAPHGWVKG
jgi:hypothetical protein